MDINLTVIVIILGIILYMLWKINNFLSIFYKEYNNKDKKIEKENKNLGGKIWTTLNPLFSEKEIAITKKSVEDWDAMFCQTFDQMKREERKEIIEWNSLQKDMAKFEPSDYLVYVIKKLALCQIYRVASFQDLRKMIEANIAIFNGITIEQAEKEYEKKKSGKSYWIDPFKINMEWVISEVDINKNNADILEQYWSDLDQRRNCWKNDWEYILNNDELDY